MAGRRPCPETVRAGQPGQLAWCRDRRAGRARRQAPMGTCQASVSRWAVGRQDCVKAVDAAAGGVHPGGVLDRRSTVRGGLGSPPVVGSPVAAGGSRLMVRLRDEEELADVEVRDRIRPGQPLLVALRHRPVLDGVCRYTRIGRVHALCWRLAFGVGELPPEAVVGVESGTRRFCAAAEARVSRLGGPWGGRRRVCGEAAGRRWCGAHRAAGGPLVKDLADSVSLRPGFDSRRPLNRPHTIRANPTAVRRAEEGSCLGRPTPSSG